MAVQLFGWVWVGCVCVCVWGGGGHHFPEFGQASKTEAIFAEKIWNLAIPTQDLFVSDNFREKNFFGKNVILAAILSFPRIWPGKQNRGYFCRKIWNLAIPTQDLFVSDNFRKKFFSEKTSFWWPSWISKMPSSEAFCTELRRGFPQHKAQKQICSANFCHNKSLSASYNK